MASFSWAAKVGKGEPRGLAVVASFPCASPSPQNRTCRITAYTASFPAIVKLSNDGVGWFDLQ